MHLSTLTASSELRLDQRTTLRDVIEEHLVVRHKHTHFELGYQQSMLRSKHIWEETVI